ncbi:MAG TPA: CpsB/CapC family capsule biosynthesis tyrosine phosphatase [Anaeromyxobacteraceae bacterium]|nr:CpsB/CapC family capsule biosynthesis tyrosine phosphatase [Anaeromyxobacteraceae bacterium]
MAFLDLHSHLLWALDDGCQTPEETLAAARLLVELGWRDSSPTPHAHPLFPSRDPAACVARLQEAQALFDREGVPLRLHAGAAENPLDEGYLDRLAPEQRRGLGPTGRWTLVELPFRSAVPALPELLFHLARRAVRPLLAHPERCVEFDKAGRAEEAARLGAAFQLNLGALVGVYGRGVRKQAERLLDAGLYAVAATDLHHPDGAEEWLPEALVALEKRAGSAAVDRLCGDNPRRILAGEELA